MQEFQSIPGLAGLLFGGAGAGDLQRAQAHAHAQQGPGARCGGVSPAAPPEAVKCPRCESTNTKFCYYNNYNLSQPRHFCKSCRRYWTKGGVLRNVPVGGGCRKTKRASSSSSSASSTTSSVPSTPTSGDAAANKNPRRSSASSPRSTNSGSASPTAAAATTPAPTPTTPATPSSNSSVAAFTTSSHHHSNPFSTIDVVAPPAPIFADQAAALASLFAPPPLPVFTFAAQPKVEAPTTPSEVQLVAGQGQAAAPSSSSVSEDMAPFASLDAAGIFELGDAASAAAYWNAGSCWTDVVHDPSLYLP